MQIKLFCHPILAIQINAFFGTTSYYSPLLKSTVRHLRHHFSFFWAKYFCYAFASCHGNNSIGRHCFKSFLPFTFRFVIIISTAVSNSSCLWGVHSEKFSLLFQKLATRFWGKMQRIWTVGWKLVDNFCGNLWRRYM